MSCSKPKSARIAMSYCSPRAKRVLDAVVQGETDFGLRFTGSREPLLQFEALTSERYVLPMPRSHGWAKRESIVWMERASQRLVAISRQSENHLLLDQIVAQWRDQPVAGYECDHLSADLALVEAGLGLTAKPQLVLRQNQAQIWGVPLSSAEVWRAMVLLERSDRSLSPGAETLRSHLLQGFGDHCALPSVSQRPGDHTLPTMQIQKRKSLRVFLL
nr:LysR substrate-binding domain-containing protein [Comamonas koreensis]